MSEKIYHRCRCLDRNFTFEEWGAYLRETEYRNDAVFTAGAFAFNINDVCLNPSSPISFECARGFHVAIETAQSPNGRWDAGYDIACHFTNSSRAAHFIDDPEEGFATEKEAVYDALRYAREVTQREMGIEERRATDLEDDDYYLDQGTRPATKKTAVLAMMQRLLACIEKQMDVYDPRQLTLWE